MTLTTDKRLGPYENLSPLGAGGMGEVWRARDTRLNREVAIKLLPASLTRYADRLRRFEQEARATSALNHPNILTVYDVGDHTCRPLYLLVQQLAMPLRRDYSLRRRRACSWSSPCMSPR